MPLKDYSTTVPVHRSIGEITEALVKAGARGVAQGYSAEGHVTGLEFAIPMPGGMAHYQLPVSADAVGKTLAKQKVQARFQAWEHVERVAWRIMRDWVLAQLAIIETQMVSLPQVMLPYLRTESGETVFERWESRQLELTRGSS